VLDQDETEGLQVALDTARSASCFAPQDEDTGREIRR
jgi:hypothetical protein